MAMTKDRILTILSFCCVVNTICIVMYVFGSYRIINDKGAAYDAAFGVETTLNLLSDFKMIGSLQSDVMPNNDALPTEKMLRTLNAFLIWNTGSTLFCYVGHIAATKFASKYENIEKMGSDVDEESYRRASLINGIITYTVIAMVKAYVLYGIYSFYVECRRGILPTVVEQALFVSAPREGTAGDQERVVILVTESSATKVDPVTGATSVTRVREVVGVSGPGTALSMAPTSPRKDDAVPTLPSQGAHTSSFEAKARSRSSSDESVFGGSRHQSQQTLEVPDAVFPAIIPSDGAVAGPSRPRHGARRVPP